ncbi:FHA domain-containing protein [Schlesneria paludicola]|uniref:FHA domain-containing protein n=1 Tax=Schlesneria paludicola TaxID=360056 RepID=UPI000299F9FE|nr:FHA domain-containing protein [Schlesneria paludicola]
MISVASTKSRHPRTARSSGLLVLEPPRHTQLPLAYLPPGKHLIGTSDICAIRVVAEGVQPRHAMLLVGDQMILLKALDPRTWVNDGVVSETTLRPGDRISIGPITYKLRIATADELLDFNAAEVETHAPAIPPEPVQVMLPSQIRPQVPPPIPPELLAEAMRFVAVLPNTESSIPAPVIKTATEDVPPVGFNQPQNVVASIVSSPAIPSEAVDIERIALDEPATPISRVECAPPVATHGLALREIHRQIAMLNDLPMVVDRGRDDARLEEERQRLNVKEAELAQLAEELSRQAQRLRDRHGQLSERESAHERKQSLLTQEQERLVAAAQSTRRDLAEEHARQKALWQEWDAAYRRTADELRDQLEFVEQRRGAFQQEAERIAESRIELQRLREDIERDRRVAATERVQAAQELGELHSTRAAFETTRRQHSVETQERETQLTNERHALAMLQDELLAAQQRMEHDRTSFAAERSAESRQREQEVRELTQARMRLNDEETSLHSLRIELESDRQSFEQERESLRRERERFDATRSDVDGLRTELSQVKCELDLHRQSLDEHLRAKRTADEQLAQLQAEIERVRQSRSDLEMKLEAERRELQRERNGYEFERADVGGLQAELDRLRQRKIVLESELESERRDLQRERNAYDFERADVEQLQADLNLARAQLVEHERIFLGHAQGKDSVDSEVHRLQAEVEELRQSDNALRLQLDAERHQRQLERESFLATREEMSVALTASHAAQYRFVEPSSDDDSPTGPGTAGHWRHESVPTSTSEMTSLLGPESSYESLTGSMTMLPPPIPADGLSSTSSVAWSGQSIGDNPVDEVPPAHQSGLCHSDEVINCRDENVWSSARGTEPTLESESPSSIQTTAMAYHEAFADEPLPPQHQEDEVARRVIETIDSTLSGMSQLFGTNALTHEASQHDVESFERNSLDQVGGTRFDATEPSLGIESAFRRASGDGEDLSLPNLRAQLAQMFDLPESPSSTFERSSEDQRLSETAPIQSEELLESLSQSTISCDAGRAQSDVLTTTAEIASGDSPDSAGTAVVTTDESEEDNAWTRRLRELSQLAAPEPSPAPAPTSPVVAVPPELPAPEIVTESSEVDEYSVEAQLARLLGKPRRFPDTASGATPSESAPEEPKPFAVYVPPVESAPEFNAEDRSHLLAEPRHRQNKNAIREEVQSFRAVAQMSARTALAKHTWDNLRNEFYLTSTLTSISAVATAWYLGSFVVGNETESWKGLACGLATLLASQRLIRASKQLSQWRRKNLLRTSTKKAPAPPLSLVVDAAVSDAGLSDASKEISSDN